MQFTYLKVKKLHFRRISNYKYIKRKSNNYTRRIAIQIGKSVRTIKTYMAKIQEEGLIERKNGKKNGEWKVNV